MKTSKAEIQQYFHGRADSWNEGQDAYVAFVKSLEEAGVKMDETKIYNLDQHLNALPEGVFLVKTSKRLEWKWATQHSEESRRALVGKVVTEEEFYGEL